MCDVEFGKKLKDEQENYQSPIKKLNMTLSPDSEKLSQYDAVHFLRSEGLPGDTIH
jgi:hypothetical protein